MASNYIEAFRSVNFHVIVESVLSNEEDYNVCSCGLKFNYRKTVAQADGHLFQGEVIRRTILDADVEGLMGPNYVLLCQDCGETWPTKVKRMGLFGIPYFKAAETLAQHPSCSFRK